MSENIIVIRIMGGLGNQLFQYAFARNLKEEGYKVFLDSSRIYRNFVEEKIFQQREYQLNKYRIRIPTVNSEDYKKWAYLNNKNFMDSILFEFGKMELIKNCFIKEEWKSVDWRPRKDKNYYLWGVFQSEMHFENIREIILKDLQPKKQVLIENIINNKLKYNEVVSVHVRRGDYLQHKKQLGLCNLDYYKNAILYIQKKVINPIFFFFSDDIEWVKKHIGVQMEDEFYYINVDRKMQDYEELYLMSRCHHNIIANSSFSWWGAWLNSNPDKLVIAPKVWFRNGTNKNIVPSRWCKL